MGRLKAFYSFEFRLASCCVVLDRRLDRDHNGHNRKTDVSITSSDFILAMLAVLDQRLYGSGYKTVVQSKSYSAGRQASEKA